MIPLLGSPPSCLISVHHFAELVLDLVEHARCMDALGKIPGLQQVRPFAGIELILSHSLLDLAILTAIVGS
jgi:hypothetical protein